MAELTRRAVLTSYEKCWTDPWGERNWALLVKDFVVLTRTRVPYSYHNGYYQVNTELWISDDGRDFRPSLPMDFAGETVWRSPDDELYRPYFPIYRYVDPDGNPWTWPEENP